MRFDDATLARLRATIMKRGHVLATLLSDVLAGKDRVSAIERLVGARPGMRPEEILRATLEQVEGRRKLLDARDDRFGRCDTCGEDLGLPALEEMPWADSCHKHAARA